MEFLKNSKAYVNYSPEYCGYAIRIIQKENGKLFVPIVEQILWKEYQEGNMIEPILVSEFTDGRSESEKGNLYGENLALKNLEAIRWFIFGDINNQPQVTYVPVMMEFEKSYAEVKDWIETSYFDSSDD